MAATKKGSPSSGKKSGGKKSSKKTSKRSAKKALPKTTVESLALEAAEPAISCGSCVIETIQAHCGRRVGSLDDKLRDVCSPCDIGVMADLADALIARCDAPSSLTLTCSLSVRQVIKRVCE